MWKSVDLPCPEINGLEARRVDAPCLPLTVEQPGIGTLVENARDPETRRLYLARTSYFVYYRPRGKYLEVVAFWHSSREYGPSV